MAIVLIRCDQCGRDINVCPVKNYSQFYAEIKVGTHGKPQTLAFIEKEDSEKTGVEETIYLCEVCLDRSLDFLKGNIHPPHYQRA